MIDVPDSEHGCPDDETLLAYARGRLSDHDQRTTEAHVDSCSACEELVAALVDINASLPDDPPKSAAPLLDPSSISSGPSIRNGRLFLAATRRYEHGELFAGFDIERGDKVLIAEFPPAAPDALARASSAAKRLVSLRHPNVIGALDVQVRDGRLSVVFEFVPNQTLAQWVDSRTRTWSDCVRMLAGLAAGLDALHQAGVVHGRISADHAFCPDDGLGRWGHVALFDDGAQLDPLSDQYEFCAVAYSVLHRAPWQADNRFRDDLPAVVSQALRRGLDPDPTKRFDSMGPLASELARARSPRPQH